MLRRALTGFGRGFGSGRGDADTATDGLGPGAWGLEVRVPFLHHEMVELAARMPPELKLKQGGKYPLKAISRGVIHAAVIDRPKGYFPVPALKHVRGAF